jgi:hypothetical protein
MGGIQYHRNSHLDLYTYGGDEYTGRHAGPGPGISSTCSRFTEISKLRNKFRNNHA